MKKSEFKEYLKTEILKMNEATKEEVDMQKELNAELEKTKELTSQMEGKVKKSEFKEYLRNEILAEIAEAEEEEVDVEAEKEMTAEPDAETFNFEDPGFEATGAEDIDAITDELVKLAKDAKAAGLIELANQILNSAKFSAKTEFKKVEKEA